MRGWRAFLFCIFWWKLEKGACGGQRSPFGHARRNKQSIPKATGGREPKHLPAAPSAGWEVLKCEQQSRIHPGFPGWGFTRGTLGSCVQVLTSCPCQHRALLPRQLRIAPQSARAPVAARGPPILQRRWPCCWFPSSILPQHHCWVFVCSSPSSPAAALCLSCCISPRLCSSRLRPCLGGALRFLQLGYF